MDPEGTPLAHRPPPSSRGRLLPLVGLGVGLLLTLVGWRGMARLERSRLAELERVQAEAILERLDRRVKSLVQTLRGASLYLARPGGIPTRAEWHDYVEDLGFTKAYPGLQGLSFVQWIPTGEREAHEQRLRKEGFTGYRVIPGGPLPPDPEGCSSILYLEPMDERNQRAFGRDMWAEPTRRAAMARARDLGLPSLTGPVTLYQEGSADVQAGVVLFVPVYAPGPDLHTVAERRRRLRGWASCPMRMADMMDGLPGASTVTGRVALMDPAAAAPLLYHSGPGRAVAGLPGTLELPLDVGGRTWRLHVAFGSAFRTAHGEGQALLLLAAGTLVSFLLFALLRATGKAAARAVAAAEAREAEVLASEARYRAFFERAPVGMAIVESLSGRFLSVNPKLAAILGYSREELQQRTFMSLTHPDHLEADVASVQALVSGQVPEVIKEKRYLHRDGHAVWARLAFVRVNTAEGAAPQHVALVEDITQEKALAQSRATEAAFRHSVLDAIPAHIAVLDGEGRIVDVNERWKTFARANGADPEDPRVGVGARYLDTMGSELGSSAAEPRQGIEEVMAGKRPEFLWDYACPGPNAPRWFQLRAVPIPGHAGCLVAHFEISPLKQAEEALKAREALFSAVFELSPDPITISEVESGRFLRVNRAWSEMLGLEAQDVVGRRSMEFNLWKDPADRSRILEALRCDGRVDGVQVTLQTVAGQSVKVLLSARKIRVGQQDLALVAAKDATNLLEAQELLLEQRDRFKRLVDTSMEAIHVLDRKGRLRLWNEAFLRHLGYTEEETAGLTVADWDRQWDDPELLRMIPDLMIHPRTFETVHERKDGTLAHVEVSATLIHLDGEEMLFTAARDVTERHRAEAALRESEALFRAFFEKNLAVMLLVEPLGGSIQDANEAASLFYGWSRDTLLQMTFPGLHALPPEAVKAEMDRARSEQRMAHRLQHRRAQGDVRDVVVYSSPIIRNGRPLLFVIIHDVTEEVAAQAALAHSERLFRDLFDLLPLGVTLTDGSGQIVRTNPASEALLGIPSEDLLRRAFKGPYWEIVRPDGLPMPPEEYASVRAMAEGRRVENVEMGVRRPEGALTWLTVTAEPLEGGRAGVLIVYSDISQRKHMEEALRASEARWRFALDGSGEGVWDWNAVTNEVYFSPQWKAMLGYGDHEVGNTLSEWDSRVHPEDKAQVYATLEAYFRGETPAYMSEHRVRHKDGTYKWILDRGMVVTWEAPGKPLRVIGTHTDITERRLLEEAEARAMKAESLVLMAGSIAHDFNNLFQALQSSLDLAELKAAGSPGVPPALDMARGILRRAVNLSWRMLDFSGRAMARLEPLDLELALMQWAPELARGLDDPTRLRLDLHPVGRIQADPIQLHRVVALIMENAREAMGTGGSPEGVIRWRLFEDEGSDRPGSQSPGIWPLDPPAGPRTVCLEIADEGPGVEPKLLPRIFDPFFTTKELGRGLGLASVHGLLKAHGAGLHVFPGAERGLTLRLHFPVEDPA